MVSQATSSFLFGLSVTPSDQMSQDMNQMFETFIKSFLLHIFIFIFRLVISLTLKITALAEDDDDDGDGVLDEDEDDGDDEL